MAASPALAAFLVLSNVAIVPAIAYAYWRRLFPETAVLCAVLAASTAFHVCQVGWFCFGVGVDALQVTDHFMVYSALVWFSLYFAGASERARTSITIAAMAVILPVIVAFIGSWMSGAVIVAIVLVLTVATLMYVFSVHGDGPAVAWGAFIVALGLLGLGVLLHVFGGDFGDENWKYPVAHSVWHVLSMLSLYYVLGIPFRDNSALKNFHGIDGRTGGKKPKRRPNGGDIALSVVGAAAVGILSKATRAPQQSRSKQKQHHQKQATAGFGGARGSGASKPLSLGNAHPDPFRDAVFI